MQLLCNTTHFILAGRTLTAGAEMWTKAQFTHLNSPEARMSLSMPRPVLFDWSSTVECDRSSAAQGRQVGGYATPDAGSESGSADDVYSISPSIVIRQNARTSALCLPKHTGLSARSDGRYLHLAGAESRRTPRGGRVRKITRSLCFFT
jgi:hypothetical protein